MQQLAGAQLLLVEDNELNQELAIEILKEAQVATTVANNGKEALTILGNGSDFDGILMDCQMPIMDGYEATRLIRQNPDWKDLPIIAMTANAMAGDKEKVLAAGMNDHIAKPLDLDQMFATLAQWIHPRSEASPTAQQTSEQATSAPFDRLAGIPGLNQNKGLANSLNKPELYQRLLGKFARDQQSFAQDITNALKQQDISTATRLAHTLKGVAGSIGAEALAQAANDLEDACQHNSPQLNEILTYTLAHLTPLLTGLSNITADQSELATSAETPSTPLPESCAEFLQHLQTLIEEQDAEALTMAESLLQCCQSTPWENLCRSLLNQLQHYDFDNALTQLTLLQEKSLKTTKTQP